MPPAVQDLSKRVAETYAASSARTVLVRGRLEESPDATTSGTGAVLTASGIIVTCAHVVEGAEDLEVLFPSGRRHRAVLLGRHPKADVALVQIRAGRLDPFPVRTETPPGGEWVLALGYPGGPGVDLAPAPALGRVRRTGYNLAESVTGRMYHSMIATDTPIFQGNSGGPLVDLSGNLIGINAAISVGESEAYSIPIGRILEWFAQLKTGRTIDVDPPLGRATRPSRTHARGGIDELFGPVGLLATGWIVRVLDGTSHLGYGVVVGKGGRIAVPHFLVSPFRRVAIRTEGGETFDATVGATDHRFGMTLLHADVDLPVAPLAPVEEIVPGRFVVSVGTRRRVLGVGLIGAIDREVQKEKTSRLLGQLVGYDLATLSPPIDLQRVVQHDTPLALSDLGCPLVDLEGRLVAFNLSNSVRGASYAPAAHSVLKNLAELSLGRDIVPPPRPFLGVDLRELSPEEIEERGLDGGLLIEEVLGGFCAERAGLAAGDVLVTLGGVRIRVVEQLADVLGRMKPGSQTSIQISRAGSVRDVTIVLDRSP